MNVGTITDFGSKASFFVPVDASSIYVSGQSFPISGPVTTMYVDVKTKPSNFGDFLWALGAPRKFTIENVNVSVTPPHKEDAK